jgi:predicted AlkP superfamily phosphohydrolase/phosphomutase
VTTNRLCVIGIDALDPDLLMQWRSELPTFDRLMQAGRWGRLESTFPPDSIPAWTTIVTGLDPSEHGGLEYVNYLDIRSGAVTLDNSRLRGRTFWDRASASGKRVVVLNPFMAYPAWPVNGLMIAGPVFVDGRASVIPEATSLPSALPELGGMVEFPTRHTRREFYERCVRVTVEQGRFFGDVLGTQDWDLAFVLFLTLDRVKHFYWRFEDTTDPCHEPWDEEPHPIKRFYALFDKVVGELLAGLPADTTVLLLSDHGHQRRCTRLFYINEVLRRAGLLAAPHGLASFVAPGAILERVKNLVLDVAYTWNLEEWVTAAARWIPRRKALKRSDHTIRNDVSLARTSSFAGVNPFGGISINAGESERRGRSREQVLEEVVQLLAAAVDPATHQPVVRWVRRREDVLPPGAHLAAYPDLLFELDPEYGVSWSIYHSTYGPNVTHRKVSGGHRRDGAVLASGPSAPSIPPVGLRVGQMHSLILDLLSV